MPNHEVASAIVNLKQAIEENDIRKLRKVLSKFSLLRDKSISKEFLEDHSKNEELEHMRQLFDVLSKIRSPEMIYTILTAGFSVFDLGAIFKSNRANKSYIMLMNMLPSLTQQQIQAVGDQAIPVCVYTRDVARIPVKGLGVNYDLHSIFHAIIKFLPFDPLSQTTGLGFRNEFFKNDDLELDLELIQKVLQNIPELTTNAQCIASINNDIAEFNNQTEKRLKDIQFKSYCFTAYLFLVAGFLFFTEQQIYKYLATLPEEEIVRLWNSYHDILKLCSLLLQGTLLPGGLYLALKKNEYDELRATPKLQLEPNELEFDFHAAQKNLTKDISKRFASEFSSEPKPASLLFWKQAFDAQAANARAGQKKTPDTPENNRSLLRMA